MTEKEQVQKIVKSIIKVSLISQKMPQQKKLKQ